MEHPAPPLTFFSELLPFSPVDISPPQRLIQKMRRNEDSKAYHEGFDHPDEDHHYRQAESDSFPNTEDIM